MGHFSRRYFRRSSGMRNWLDLVMDNSDDAFGLIIVLVVFFGYVMNFQNLFQYDVGQKEFIVSLVGVFVPILGVITGWVW